ncbi:MAG: hypothetical protein CMJ74_11610 [Planctomycetaceae bacterium]|nr:hypothetical protein [Planctomycetaceae bacterium]|tara:strand:+ start:814 stop:1011 length:198 start_codon:yes stop_codon:yes gene_type:complete
MVRVAITVTNKFALVAPRIDGLCVAEGQPAIASFPTISVGGMDWTFLAELGTFPRPQTQYQPVVA